MSRQGPQDPHVEALKEGATKGCRISVLDFLTEDDPDDLLYDKNNPLTVDILTYLQTDSPAPATPEAAYTDHRGRPLKDSEPSKKKTARMATACLNFPGKLLTKTSSVYATLGNAMDGYPGGDFQVRNVNSKNLRRTLSEEGSIGSQVQPRLVRAKKTKSIEASNESLNRITLSSSDDVLPVRPTADRGKRFGSTARSKNQPSKDKDTLPPTLDRTESNVSLSEGAMEAVQSLLAGNTTNEEFDDEVVGALEMMFEQRSSIVHRTSSMCSLRSSCKSKRESGSDSREIKWRPISAEVDAEAQADMGLYELLLSHDTGVDDPVLRLYDEFADRQLKSLQDELSPVQSPCLSPRAVSERRKTDEKQALNKSRESRRGHATRSEGTDEGVQGEASTSKHRQEIDMSSRKLTMFPSTVLRCPGLETLRLNCNALQEIKSNDFRICMGNWQLTLTTLDLSYNCFKALPPELGLLYNLRDLYINHNQLLVLPSELGCITKLETLDASFNLLSQIPLELCRLPLKALNLDGNPVVFPPPATVAKGTSAILACLSTVQTYLNCQHVKQSPHPAQPIDSKIESIVNEEGRARRKLSRHLSIEDQRWIPSFPKQPRWFDTTSERPRVEPAHEEASPAKELDVYLKHRPSKVFSVSAAPLHSPFEVTLMQRKLEALCRRATSESMGSLLAYQTLLFLKYICADSSCKPLIPSALIMSHEQFKSNSTDREEFMLFVMSRLPSLDLASISMMAKYLAYFSDHTTCSYDFPNRFSRLYLQDPLAGGEPYSVPSTPTTPSTPQATVNSKRREVVSQLNRLHSVLCENGEDKPKEYQTSRRSRDNSLKLGSKREASSPEEKQPETTRSRSADGRKFGKRRSLTSVSVPTGNAGASPMTRRPPQSPPVDRERERDREKGDREKGDREKGDREKNDREKEKGDREKSDREKGDRPPDLGLVFQRNLQGTVKMEMLGSVSGAYGNLVHSFIRPPRAIYDESHLGPAMFHIGTRIFERTDLKLMNDSNQALACSHFKPLLPGSEADSLPCVIFLHGNSGCRLQVKNAIRQLLPYDITLFAFDFSGSGLSEGEYVTLGMNEQRDVNCVIKHLWACGTTNIGLWGVSMGAATALFVAAQHPDLKCLVLDSPFCSLTQLAMELGESSAMPKMLMRLGLKMVRKTIKKKARFDINDVEPLRSAPLCNMPVLFGHGTLDQLVNVRHSQSLYDAYGAPPEFKKLILFDKGHNDSRPREFLREASRIFKTYLKLMRPPHQTAVVKNSKKKEGNSAR